MNVEFSTIMSRLDKWSNGGTELLNNGTKLISRAPHVAPRAWLHIIYASLSNSQIETIRSAISVELPNDLVEFWGYANGVNLFSDSISIWGLRTSYVRTGEDAFQPYDIVSLNNEGIISKLKCLAFGSYSIDGSLITYDLVVSSTKVYRLEQITGKVLQEWETLWVWLESEVERLSMLYDENGVEYNPE